MKLINFAHPITGEQLEQLDRYAGVELDLEVIDVDSKVDPSTSLIPQVRAMVDAVGFTPDEWLASDDYIVNLPSLNHSAALVMAELIGRTKTIPMMVLRLAPVPDAMPRRFEVAEVLDLGHLANQARRRSLAEAERLEAERLEAFERETERLEAERLAAIKLKAERLKGLLGR